MRRILIAGHRLRRDHLSNAGPRERDMSSDRSLSRTRPSSGLYSLHSPTRTRSPTSSRASRPCSTTGVRARRGATIERAVRDVIADRRACGSNTKARRPARPRSWPRWDSSAGSRKSSPGPNTMIVERGLAALHRADCFAACLCAPVFDAGRFVLPPHSSSDVVRQRNVVTSGTLSCVQSCSSCSSFLRSLLRWAVWHKSAVNPAREAGIRTAWGAPRAAPLLRGPRARPP